VIKGVSELILAADAMPNRKLLETLSRNVDVLDRMIVELLDISELSAENLSLRQDRLNMEELLWGVVKGQDAEVRRAQLTVSVIVKDADNLYVNGDDQRLRWAFGHLLQNAIHYTEPGGNILLTITQSDGYRLAIQVVDTGVGISEKDLPHVFERFYRGEARNASGKLLDPRGLGQGLFIARRVLEAHGGYVGVHSPPGQGTIFTVVVPQA
jgi:two-component system phosphate regulon sensor histidine kinase PhoR